MQLFKLTRKICNYDEFDSFIIRAENEDGAREIAFKNAADEKLEWRDKNLSICEIVSIKGEIGVVCSSFNAG